MASSEAMSSRSARSSRSRSPTPVREEELPARDRRGSTPAGDQESSHERCRDATPTPEPGSPKRDRFPSPRRASPPPSRELPSHRRQEADRYRPAPRERLPPPPPIAKPTEEEKLAAAKTEFQKMSTMRSGGAYIPPHRLRMLQETITDKSSKEYQRMAWDALKKSINGLVNKVNVGNIKQLVMELFAENLIRGRGLLCQSLLKAQHSSLPFTSVYACLVAITNTKLPMVGELLVKRLVFRFRKAFKRSDKQVLISSTVFLASLINQQVVSEVLAAQLLLLLLQRPTNDSVEVACELMKQVGLFLEEMSPAIANAVFQQFRAILHGEADIDKRTQYQIETLFQIRKDQYKGYPIVKEELDLVEEDDQITHQIGLDDQIDVQDGLNIFKFDPNYEENENEYAKLRAEILGEGSDDEDEEDEDDSEEEEDEEQKALEIKDQTNADLVNLRRTIYLSMQASADPQEAAHRLMKLNLPAGQEPELVSMIVETCATDKVYMKFYGLLGECFTRLNRMWTELFENSFVTYYTTIHRFPTNKLRNIARFFGYMLSSRSIGWHVLSTIHLNEEETTSASRIFIKILFEDLQEEMGSAKLKAHLSDPALQPSLEGIFPHDNPKNIRFAINYFTSIKMGFLTEEMRGFLANMPKPALPAPPQADSDSDSVSSYSSYSRSTYSSRSRSRTRSPQRRGEARGRSLSRTPPRRIRDRSYSSGSRSPSRTSPRNIRDRSYSRGRSYSRSISPRRSVTRSASPRRRDDSRSASRSVSPVPRRHNQVRDRSYSRSPSRSISRSRSPSRSRVTYRRNRSMDSRSPSRSPSRSRSRSYSRSPAPPARNNRSFTASPPPNAGAVRHHRAASYSASPTPPPKRRRNSSSSRSGRSPSPPPRRRSRSPPPKRGRAAY